MNVTMRSATRNALTRDRIPLHVTSAGVRAAALNAGTPSASEVGELRWVCPRVTLVALIANCPSRLGSSGETEPCVAVDGTYPLRGRIHNW
jgi:hypothetical protein